MHFFQISTHSAFWSHFAPLQPIVHSKSRTHRFSSMNLPLLGLVYHKRLLLFFSFFFLEKHPFIEWSFMNDFFFIVHEHTILGCSWTAKKPTPPLYQYRSSNYLFSMFMNRNIASFMNSNIASFMNSSIASFMNSNSASFMNR